MPAPRRSPPRPFLLKYASLLSQRNKRENPPFFFTFPFFCEKISDLSSLRSPGIPKPSTFLLPLSALRGAVSISHKLSPRLLVRNFCFFFLSPRFTATFLTKQVFGEPRAIGSMDRFFLSDLGASFCFFTSGQKRSLIRRLFLGSFYFRSAGTCFFSLLHRADLKGTNRLMRPYLGLNFALPAL